MVKQNKECHRCYDCKKAYLMKSVPVNPVVALCTITQDRNVASTLHACDAFLARTTPVVIHPMIFAN